MFQVISDIMAQSVIMAQLYLMGNAFIMTQFLQRKEHELSS